MKQKVENQHRSLQPMSLDKLLSISKVLSKGTRYGKHCCLINLNTNTDRDIFRYPVRINAYILVVCSDGVIELSYNLFNVTLSANNMFLYNPDTIIRTNALTPSKLSIMIFTREFIDEVGITLGNVPLQYKIVRERQTFSLSEQDCRQLRTLMAITGDFVGMNKNNAHYHEMVKSAFKAFIYRAIYIMDEQYHSLSKETLPAQENNHFDKFMRLLQENYREQHYIKFYSEKMGLTPKYLSMLIKKTSGRLATEWIDDYLILEAKNLIKYSSMSIQQISYALHFPNQSFFGKYFKRHTGLSPKAYRLQQ